MSTWGKLSGAKNCHDVGVNREIERENVEEKNAHDRMNERRDL